MSAANDFLAACDKQRQLLGKMRMLWAYHKLHEVDDAENHPGAKEWHSAGNEASENMALLGALAKRAVDAVMQAKYDPAMLFEIAESAGSWERFNQAMRKNLPALKAASVLAGLVEVPKAESTTAKPATDRKQLGLAKWNADDETTWRDVCKAINDTTDPMQDEIDRVRQEITSYAKKNNLDLRKKSSGRKRGKSMRESEF